MRTTFALLAVACFMSTPLCTLADDPQLGAAGIYVDADTDRIVLRSIVDDVPELWATKPVLSYHADFFIEQGEDNWVKVGERTTNRPFLGSWEGNITVIPDATFFLWNDLRALDLFLNCDNNDPNAECPWAADGTYNFKVKWWAWVHMGHLMGFWWYMGEDDKSITVVRQPAGQGADLYDWPDWSSPDHWSDPLNNWPSNWPDPGSNPLETPEWGPPNIPNWNPPPPRPREEDDNDLGGG
ncbi:MAG: hypothetical protein ACR2NP_07845 [Pirellulaceae bacterium]